MFWPLLLADLFDLHSICSTYIYFFAASAAGVFWFWLLRAILSFDLVFMYGYICENKCSVVGKDSDCV